MPSNDYLILAIVACMSGLFLGAYAFYYVNRLLQRFKLSKRAITSIAAQEEAEELLKKYGFKIVGRQRRTDIVTYVDGNPNISMVQADFIVEKNHKYFVAEVKAGEVVSNPTEPSTRRQLLEYKFAYQPDGLILVDMIDKQLHFIDFALPERGSERIVVTAFVLMMAGIVLGLLWLFVTIKIL